MSFQPVVPFGGYAGWTFLTRTGEKQREAFNASADTKRSVDYFRENIGKVSSAEELVSDRRLLEVALGAFGLEDDINNKYFIQKVLDDGTLDQDALANKLSDKRYLEFSKAFGFGDFDTPNTVLSTFPDEMVDRYLDASFEVAVGEQNSDMRLALGLDRSLGDIAGKSTTDNGKWFSVMGNAPVRAVFETALGLPKSVGSLDLDQQLNEFREKTERYFGDSEISQFADPGKREELVRLFLLRSDIQAGNYGMSPAAAALSLLSGGQF